jgi:hypothetical protein
MDSSARDICVLPRRETGGKHVACIAPELVRTLEVVDDLRKRVLSARDVSGGALNAKYGAKFSVTSRAGVEVVFAANGDEPEVVFIVNDQPNR